MRRRSNRSRSAWFCCLTALLLGSGAAGCKSDSASDGAAGAAGIGAGGGAGEGPVDQCVGASDRAAREAPYCVTPPLVTAPDTLSVEQIASKCGVDCAFNPARQKCNHDCITENTAAALSTGCTDCIVATVECASYNCLNECLSNPLGTVCLACRCGANLPHHTNCVAAFRACTGLETVTDCEELDAGTWTPLTFDAGTCIGAAGSGGAGGSGPDASAAGSAGADAG